MELTGAMPASLTVTMLQELYSSLPASVSWCSRQARLCYNCAQNRPVARPAKFACHAAAWHSYQTSAAAVQSPCTSCWPAFDHCTLVTQWLPQATGCPLSRSITPDTWCCQGLPQFMLYHVICLLPPRPACTLSITPGGQQCRQLLQLTSDAWPEWLEPWQQDSPSHQS